MSSSQLAVQEGTQSPSLEDTPAAEISRLKRRIAQLQDEVQTVQSGRRTKKRTSTTTMGRGIRRLASMFGTLESLVFEADQRASEQDSDRDDLTEDAKLDRDRAYKGFVLMINQVPTLRTLLNDESSEPEDLDKLLAILQEGANEARGDDIRNLKLLVAEWLNKTYSPKDAFSTTSRADRGLQNDITGALLCPVEYDWNDQATRLAIKAGTLSIKDDLCLACFYPRGKGDSNNVDDKFLRSRLLVKSYCAIFTSPTSADAFEEDETEDGPTKKKGTASASRKKATKSNNATLLHMNGVVTPRSIAYVAVVWVETYNGFEYRALWEYIVDYFEDTEDDEEAKARAQELLAWWNKQVFPHHADTTTNPKKSRNRLKLQCSQRRAATMANAQQV
ncbi:hypothetical protein BJ165DRAFT_1407392 [Panaeolus papilionaceus]|nr:hypothetical protein BJ165DRAFT_1407392 [Panaeolus papilionaceus]